MREGGDMTKPLIEFDFGRPGLVWGLDAADGRTAPTEDCSSHVRTEMNRGGLPFAATGTGTLRAVLLALGASRLTYVLLIASGLLRR